MVTGKNKVTINSGKSRAPPSPSDISMGKGIYMLFGLTGFLILAGIGCLLFKNTRMGINLIISSPIPSILAVMLIKLASFPIWVFLIIAALGGGLAAGSIYLYIGYKVKEKEVDNPHKVR